MLNSCIIRLTNNTGAVIWSYRYPGLNEAITITKRGSRHVLMGDTTYITPANDYLAIPMAVAINETDGLPTGIMIYDVPNDDFAGMSMNEDGSGGYLAIGTRDTAPLDTFQLLKVGQIGGNVDCLVEHEVEAEDLMVDDIIVEIVPEDVQIDPAVYDLPYIDLPLNVFECDGSQ